MGRAVGPPHRFRSWLMIRPRKTLWDASITKPVPPPVRCPSMITRTLALLPSLAGTVLGTDWMLIGSAITCPPTVVVCTETPAPVPPVRLLVATRSGMARCPNVFLNVIVKGAPGAGPPVTSTLLIPIIDPSARLDRRGRGVEGESDRRSYRQRGCGRQSERPTGRAADHRDRLHGRADGAGIAIIDTRPQSGLRIPVDRNGVGDRGKGRLGRDRPVLRERIEPGNRHVEIGGRRGGNVKEDIVGLRVGIGLEDRRAQ